MCSVHCHLNFTSLVIKFLMIILKMKLHPRLRKIIGFKKNAQDVELNQVKEKGIIRVKLSFNVLKEKYGYIPLLEISPYPTLIQLNFFLVVSAIVVQLLLRGFFTVIFLWNFLSQMYNLDYCYINDS